jgi:hypothetical protein
MTDYEEVCLETYVSFLVIAKHPKVVADLPNLEFLNSQIIDLPENLKSNRYSYWEITSHNNLNTTDLIQHLEWLLNKIESKKNKIAELLLKDKSAKVYIYCYWKSKFGYGGPSILPPELLKRIADLNLKLWIDFNT